MKTGSATPEIHAPHGEWKARPVVAWFVRATLVVVPLVVSWIGVRFAMRLVARPAGIGPTVLWFTGAIAVSLLIHQLARRLLRQFSSLDVLFSLSLTFPAAAPSRMRAFLRSGMDNNQTKDGSAGLVDLVARLSRKDGRVGRHGNRVGGYAALIGQELKLSDEEIDRLRWAALVHDVGMLDVPQRIRDARALSAPDRTLAEQHTKHASGYLAAFSEWLAGSAKVATEHHEHWDGGGYPAGLAGEEISLAARIVAVADAYDAMTASRFYKKPISAEAARRELVDKAGSQFDPAVVRAFLNTGIEKSSAELGSIGAVVEFGSQFASFASGAGSSAAATAGLGLATAAAVASTAVVVPAILTSVESNLPRVERNVEEDPGADDSNDEGEEPTVTSITTLRPTTTSTTTSTTTTSSTTTSTTTLVPVTTTVPAPTVPPLPPPTTTTLVVVVTTTVPLPSYPTVPPTTTTVVTYPTVGG